MIYDRYSDLVFLPVNKLIKTDAFLHTKKPEMQA